MQGLMSEVLRSSVGILHSNLARVKIALQLQSNKRKVKEKIFTLRICNVRSKVS